ncbi:hypothetical protein [Streptomyces sp. L-9-10]|uniref:hypothetical protein n=1 Tax=Streptomyces sp. L-9-10 TaxID=1478131 RepID=UPI00101D05EB|nr:hypothetical protein [Streptomyces sp. L-9-10]
MSADAEMLRRLLVALRADLLDSEPEPPTVAAVRNTTQFVLSGRAFLARDGEEAETLCLTLCRYVTCLIPYVQSPHVTGWASAYELVHGAGGLLGEYDRDGASFRMAVRLAGACHDLLGPVSELVGDRL